MSGGPSDQVRITKTWSLCETLVCPILLRFNEPNESEGAVIADTTHGKQWGGEMLQYYPSPLNTYPLIHT